MLRFMLSYRYKENLRIDNCQSSIPTLLSVSIAVQLVECSVEDESNKKKIFHCQLLQYSSFVFYS